MSLQRMLIGGEMRTLINSEHLMEKMRNEVVGIFPFIKPRDHQRDENLDEF